MKRALTLAAVVALSVLAAGCAPMRCPPQGCVPFYLPPPAPVQFYPLQGGLQHQQRTTTVCMPIGGGMVHCTSN